MITREFRMKQTEKRYWHGRYGTVDCFPVFVKAKSRCKRFRPTSEMQKKINDRNSQDRFRMLIDNNFVPTDRELQLTYSVCVPETYEQCLKDIQKFLRKVRDYYKKEFKVKLKYVGVIEKGVKRGKFHAHIIINIPDPCRWADIENKLDKFWMFGSIDIAAKLRFNEEGMAGMAKYLVCNPEKPEVEGKVKKWIQSKGLKKPKTSYRTGRISSKMAREIINGDVTERELEKLYPGYVVTSIERYGEYNEIEDADGKKKKEIDYRRSYFRLRLYKQTWKE